MPLTLVQGSSLGAWGATNTGSGTGSISVTWASARTVGSLLLLWLNSDSTESTPTGWNLDKSQINNAGQYLFSRISDNTATDAPTFSSAFSKGIAWAEYTGNTATPADVFQSTGTGVNSSAAWSTGTTASTAQADELAIASWSSSVNANPAATWSGETNSFVEQTDQSTTAAAGQNVSLATAVLALNSIQTVESTATPSISCGRQAIVGTYKAAVVATAPDSFIYPPNRRQSRLRLIQPQQDISGQTGATEGNNTATIAPVATPRGWLVGPLALRHRYVVPPPNPDISGNTGETQGNNTAVVVPVVIPHGWPVGPIALRHRYQIQPQQDISGQTGTTEGNNQASIAPVVIIKGMRVGPIVLRRMYQIPVQPDTTAAIILQQSDTGIGDDEQALIAFNANAEGGTGVEGIVLTAFNQTSDTGAGIESNAAFVFSQLSDAGIGVENYSSLGILFRSDTGQEFEAYTITITGVAGSGLLLLRRRR